MHLKQRLADVLLVLTPIMTKHVLLSLGLIVVMTTTLPAQAKSLDLSDDYIKEIFGTPVPDQQTPAELAAQGGLRAPLPNIIIDNGPPPVPHNITTSQTLIASAAGHTQTFSSRNLLWPMRGGLVSSRFGWRSGRMHQGTDIAAPYGTPIMAAASGKVVFSGWEGGYGQLVIVDHGNGTQTKYGHCSQRLVSLGQSVRQGQVIGKVGSTGHATGPHLHYEVIRSGLASNPEHFTRRR